MTGIASAIVVALVCVVAAQQTAKIAVPAGLGKRNGAGRGENDGRKAFVTSMVALDLENLDAQTREEKLALMRADAFAFFRGTARIFYNDLHTEMPASALRLENITTWLSGDAHVENYGAFDNSDGTVVYDLNDFDEAFVADFRFDLWRATTSIVLTCKATNDDDDCEGAVKSFSTAYAEQLERFVGNDDELSFEITRESAYGRLDDFLADVEKSKSRKKMIKKWTRHSEEEKGTRVFDLRLDKLGAVSSSTAGVIRDALVNYQKGVAPALRNQTSFFKVKDIAQRLKAGLGSYGTARYYVLVEGPSMDPYDDIILDVKIERAPHTALALGDAQRAVVMSSKQVGNKEGARVALGNRALLNHADLFLGNASFHGASYSVRQRNPFKDTFDLSELTSAKRLRKLSEQWGQLLAAAHARSDDDFDPSLVPHSFETMASLALRGHHAEFADEIWQTANAYASQVATDFSYFVSAFPPSFMPSEANKWNTKIAAHVAEALEEKNV
ncbi:Hypothetical Protein FCC1311_067542 [Hondaea fermentalgiana]|uniref:DUF2252 domain-containing protein n=1 Tax=Hondaea fermentalgiana TaxID=2315210 RepID=A0A2R5GRM5_9STRA|nr:Hypothetical Protein FCC1311_067542 [Hondaea fermentalgiana]|eukprot:GBG30534.1 Hypothetical Protein FCC1311_067542 [Hondaea fermentalgiana]